MYSLVFQLANRLKQDSMRHLYQNETNMRGSQSAKESPMFCLTYFHRSSMPVFWRYTCVPCKIGTTCYFPTIGRVREPLLSH